MANFNEALLTKKGIALLAKTQAGQTGVKLTKAAAGCGTYEEGESLVEREALKDQRQVFPLDKLSVQNSTTVSIRFTITNEQETGNLQEGYYVKEVGIFAEDPDEGEILYAIATTVTDQWDYMPAYNSLLPAYITVEFYVEVSNAASVTIVCNGRFITAEEMEEELEKLRADAKAEHQQMREDAKTAHDEIKKQIEDAGTVPDGVLTEKDKGVIDGVASLDYAGKLRREQISKESGAVYLEPANGQWPCKFKDFTWKRVGDLDHADSTETGWVGVYTGYKVHNWQYVREATCERRWHEAQAILSYDYLRATTNEDWADYYMSAFYRLHFQTYFWIDDEGNATIKIFSDSNLGEMVGDGVSGVADLLFWLFAIRRLDPEEL